MVNASKVRKKNGKEYCKNRLFVKVEDKQ